MKIGQLVRFNIINDEFNYASICFGVEPENNWFNIQVYTEEVYGEIVKNNTIELIYDTGKKSENRKKCIPSSIRVEVSQEIKKGRCFSLEKCH